MERRTLFRIPTAEEAATLRRELDAAGYTQPGLVARFGVANAVALDPEREASFRYATRRGDPVDVLTWLFLLGRPVPTTDTDRISPDLIGCAERVGLIRRDGGHHVATCLLARHDHLVLASDRYDPGEEGTRDHVLSTGPVARHLAHFIVERPGARVLDVCGGGGVQGLLAARWAREVWITDISERAIEYARRNAALNDVANCEFRVGPGFEPVAGERFDQIICNPPFIVMPSQDLVAVNSGLELDDLCRDLTRASLEHLEPGGLYQMIFEWTEQHDEPWPRRLAGWLEGLPCDAWTLRAYTRHPHGYAVSRINELLRVTGGDDRALDRWMAYYEARGVTAIHGGVLALRRASSRSWLHFDDLEAVPEAPFGAAIRVALEAFDRLAELRSDDDVLDARFALAPGVRLQSSYAPGTGGWTLAETELHAADPLPRRQGIAPPVADFVGRLDGRSPLRAHVEDLFARLDAAPEQVVADSVRVVRHLAGRGFLTRTD